MITYPHISVPVRLALGEAGGRYEHVTDSFSDPHPAAADCSELTRWSTGRAHLLAGDGYPPLPDGSWAQATWCARFGRRLTVAQGIDTYGALLFEQWEQSPGFFPWNGGNGHVVWSLGDGRTIEARGHAYGINEFSAHGRPFNVAFECPFFTYDGATAPPPGPIVKPEVTVQQILLPDQPMRWGRYKGKRPFLLTDGLPNPLAASPLLTTEVDLLRGFGVPVQVVPLSWLTRVSILERADGQFPG